MQGVTVCLKASHEENNVRLSECSSVTHLHNYVLLLDLLFVDQHQVTTLKLQLFLLEDDRFCNEF